MKRIHFILPSYPLAWPDIENARTYLEKKGMDIIVPPDLLGEDLFCAHHQAKRLSLLKAALTDPTVDIVWLLNGGYGLSPLIPDLLSLPKPDKEKLFIGFSDGTALHVFLNQFWQWPSLHGPGAFQLTKKSLSPPTIEATLKFVVEGLATYPPPPLYPFNEKAATFSHLSGQLVGGNLCLLTCSLGTPWHFQPQEKIIFLEDVNEQGYRIDRMLVQLHQAGVFYKAKAIILGDFVKGEEKNGCSLIPEVLERFAANSDLPVFRLYGCGHGKENYPLPFNQQIVFSVEK